MKKNETIIETLEGIGINAKQLITPIIISILGVWYESGLIFILGVILVVINLYK